jgi:hypothetical protein|tara:strand:+ start:51 stop:476 length:426 start_codon:yes stop_codon:yes gene_type:complete
MDLAIEKIWHKWFGEMSINDLSNLGKEKFLRSTLEHFELNGLIPETDDRIVMAALIDVVETQDDILGGMNLVQTIDGTTNQINKSTDEWINNYRELGYTLIPDETKEYMRAVCLGKLEKGTLSNEEEIMLVIQIDQSIKQA